VGTGDSPVPAVRSLAAHGNRHRQLLPPPNPARFARPHGIGASPERPLLASVTKCSWISCARFPAPMESSVLQHHRVHSELRRQPAL